MRPGSQADLLQSAYAHSRDLACSCRAYDIVRFEGRPQGAARGTYGRMRRLVVDVDEGTLDTWEGLYFVLQLFGKVVRLPQGCVRVHYDVELDEVVLFPRELSQPAAQCATCEGEARTGPLCVKRVARRREGEGQVRGSVGARGRIRERRGLTWYARTVSIFSISSLKVTAL